MSSSELAAARDMADSLARNLADAVDAGRFDLLDEAAFADLFGAMIRFYAEKAQFDGASAPLAGGNSVITGTDAMIACTAILNEADIEPFELTLWRSMSSILPRDHAASPVRGAAA